MRVLPILAAVLLFVLVFALFKSWRAIRTFLASKFGRKPPQSAATVG